MRVRKGMYASERELRELEAAYVAVGHPNEFKLINPQHLGRDVVLAQTDYLRRLAIELAQGVPQDAP